MSARVSSVAAPPAIDPVELCRALIRRPSVTPIDAGAIDVLIETLTPLGFRCRDVTFEESGAAPVRNLYARLGAEGPNFCFAGHTDVVPPGDESGWRAPPFDAAVDDGRIWGRGAADMKGAIASFLAAVSQIVGTGPPNGSISLLITGDEEGPAINGTRKALAMLADAGERIDHCLVGEPTSLERLGDMMKVGRRGSMNAWLTVYGVQGHVAYPHRANNPIPALMRTLTALCDGPLDDGYPRFQPSSLQITDIHVGNPAHNVIPGRATARFNIRFNPTWTGVSLEAFLKERLDEAVAALGGARYALECVVSGEAFLTEDDAFVDLVANAVAAVTGARPELSTSGGTSDARFIKDAAPVVEFGLVGASMHKVDEHVAIDDLEALSTIYAKVLTDYFAAPPAPRR
ncbi:MAG: succinyl-diaminopimelate desuccinylase [Alphaproteobacteria bacterium]|nr:succinyl-diaminopimelate desuccinylase [Alphaproteobacteria bacterium]